jgi:hypothetical protein
MARRRIAGMVAALVLLLGGVAGAAKLTRVEITPDNGPPVFHDQLLFDLLEGEVFALHDDEWAVIPFYRDPDDIPAGFDLLQDFDPGAAFGADLLIGGFAVFDEGSTFPRTTQVQGLGAVPVWFVSWEELQGETADLSLTIEELEGMDSLVKGTATLFQEQNHSSVHPVSHLALLARGTLDGGGTFEVNAVEVALEFVRLEIDLDFD